MSNQLTSAQPVGRKAKALLGEAGPLSQWTTTVNLTVRVLMLKWPTSKRSMIANMQTIIVAHAAIVYLIIMTPIVTAKTPGNHRKSPIFMASAILLLSGCTAQTGNFPTISKRSIETLPIDDQPDAERLANRDGLQILRVDSETLNDLANQNVKAQQSHNAFTDNLARTRKSAARAGAKGSESWAQAQSELSDLIVLRNRTATALAAIDALVISTQQNAIEQNMQVDMSPLLKAQRQAAGFVESEDAELARLNQNLRR